MVLTCVSLVLGVHAETIVIDCSKTVGGFRNIAGGINFWGAETAQERFIEEVGADLYRLKIRLHEVSRSDGTYVDFPWQGNDLSTEEMKTIIKNLNAARSVGCRTMLQVYGIPKWLSVSDDEEVITNALPNFAKYPPKDHEEWKKLVRATIEALRKLGLRKVDYYEIFGEVNVGSTWYSQMMPCKKMGKITHGCRPNTLGHSSAEVMREFFKLYRSTAEAIRSVDSTAKIGGLGIIPNPSGIWWTRAFAEYVRLKGLPLDFYSWHWYGIDEALSSLIRKVGARQVTMDLVQRHFGRKLAAQGFGKAEIAMFAQDLHVYLAELTRFGSSAVKKPYTYVSSHLKRILNDEGFGEVDLFLTEWNVNHSPDRRHDTHYGASFLTMGLMDIADSDTEKQNFYSLSSRGTLSGGRQKYVGDYGLFAGAGPWVPKAGFNAFKLFGMLGDNAERLNVNVDGNDVYATATKADDSVSVLVTYYVMDEHPDYNLKKAVSVRVIHLPFPEHRCRVFRIDGAHSNGFYDSGPELESTDQGKVDKDFEKRFEIPIYGTLMIRFHKP
jgi:hypothetical protein